MKPYIYCHMLSSVDGKTDGAALAVVTGKGEYEETGAKLNGDALWIRYEVVRSENKSKEKQ